MKHHTTSAIHTCQRTQPTANSLQAYAHGEFAGTLHSLALVPIKNNYAQSISQKNLMPELNFSFDTIYIIESLEDRDVKTGKLLTEDLKIRQLKYQKNYNLHFVSINTKNEFFNYISNIKQEILTKNIFPYIHLEFHGDEEKEGLVTKAGELIKWQELKHRFMEINSLTKNNLCVSLASCFGANIFSIINPMEGAPFQGFVGTWDSVDYEQLLNFTSYFEEIFQSGNLNKAIENLNRDNPGYEKVNIGYYNSEEIFERAWIVYEEETFGSKEGFQERVDSIFGKAMKNPNIIRNYNIAFLRAEIGNYLLQQKSSLKEIARKRFLYED